MAFSQSFALRWTIAALLRHATCSATPRAAKRPLRYHIGASFAAHVRPSMYCVAATSSFPFRSATDPAVLNEFASLSAASAAARPLRA